MSKHKFKIGQTYEFCGIFTKEHVRYTIEKIDGDNIEIRVNSISKQYIKIDLTLIKQIFNNNGDEYIVLYEIDGIKHIINAK